MKKTTLLLINVFLILSLCVGNIILWSIPYYRFSYEPYKAYYLTTETNKHGDPIPHKTDCDCEYTRYNFGELFYYDDQYSISISGKTKTFDILGTKLKVTHKESKKIDYSSVLNKIYKSDNGDTVWCDVRSGIVTRYSAGNSIVRIFDGLIKSEEELKNVISSHIGEKVDLSQFVFSYYLKSTAHSEKFNFDEVSTYPEEKIRIHATYERYIDEILTAEKIEYTITHDGRLMYFSHNANNEFDSATNLKIDMDRCNELINAKLNDMSQNFEYQINRYDQSEYLAYIDGQYVLVADISPYLANADPITLAIPLTNMRMPIINISPTVKTVISVSSAVLLSASITVSIIISHKKSTPVPTEQEEVTE